MPNKEILRRIILPAVAALSISPQIAHATVFDAASPPPIVDTAPTKEVLPYYQPVVQMWHEIGSPAGFKQEMLALLSRGSIVSMDEFVEGLNQTTEEKASATIFSKPTFLITLDDGLLSQQNAVTAVEQIQQETGIFIPLNFFVMTQFENSPLPIEEIPDKTPSYDDGVHRYMNKEQLIDLLRKGHAIHNHTVNHANLPTISLPAAQAEVVEGERRIEKLWEIADVERKYKVFAYPNGSYSGRTTLISEIYDAAFFSRQDTGISDTNRYILGRTPKS